ncbi:heat shock protein GrpE [Listeria floridensis FSL S10-1187]|uniref:Protein GrpE n=1 Tax=Listeria floridensis FSL S10-1187 TaxID=1265817 RepID=A0ABN0RHF8_9LIST|nr:nucleotide exchange factor GrpE [Listeria floridensis]EUJ33342.1 heat shock protein GrpE [Listeria floridensis FSL S10-1187]
MSEPKDKQTKIEDEIEKEAEIEANETIEQMDEQNDVTEIDQKLAELEEKLEASENRYLRLQADFENVKKRTISDREAAMKYRSQSLAEDLLPALDSFEKALATASDNEEVAAILTGLEMVHGQIVAALKKEGIEPIEALGEQFDPNFHQAVLQDNDPEKASNEITAELQKGYKIKDRVIRPSMVKVNE